MSQRDVEKAERELLEAARGEEPSEAVQERVLAELLEAPSGARPTSRWTWWVGALSVLALGLFTLWRVSTPSPARVVALETPAPAAPAPEVRADVPDAGAPTEVTEGPAPFPTGSPPLADAGTSPGPKPKERAPPRPSREPEDELARELALLDGARSALATSPTAALTRLEQYRREFPRGALSTEAELVRLEALVSAGRAREARALGQRLSGGAGGGPLAERVNRLLEGAAR